jgi:hypothetical protein
LDLRSTAGSYHESSEYGVERNPTTATTYGWLGAKQRFSLSLADDDSTLICRIIPGGEEGHGPNRE